jgi:hypothetical protein
MIGHDAMTGAAKRSEIARLFVPQPLIGAVMNFDCGARAVDVAKSAAETGRLELSKSSGVLSPSATANVFGIIHSALQFGYQIYPNDLIWKDLGIKKVQNRN